MVGRWLGATSMRHEAREIRLRARAVIGAVLVTTVGLAGILAVILVGGANSLISRAAEQRAQGSLGLLVAIGGDMPPLTAALVDHGLSPTTRTELNEMVQRGQGQKLLSSMSLWDANGDVVYSLDGGGGRWLQSPSIRRQVATVLHGHAVTGRNPSELDLTSQRRTGTLEAFAPLRDGRGHVFAALEIDLPLKPIVAQTAQQRRDILIFVIAASSILWLLLLPFATRTAVATARARIPGRRRLLGDFQRALDHGAVELLYQPQIRTKDGSVHGFEALVRWRRDGRLRTPDTFLPVVEGSALMKDLSDRVIELATAQLAAWRREGYTPRVSINLSAKDLDDGTVASRINAALSRHEIPSDQLTVEVTETAILGDVECARHVLSEISELGVQIAVDDFGTGHASISRLHQFPIDEVKVDRSFVTPTDARTRSYLRAIVGFGQNLGLRVVAEGVEDGRTLAFLGDMGCDIAQGYHIGRPLPAGQIQDWLSANETPQAPDPSPTISRV